MPEGGSQKQVFCLSKRNGSQSRFRLGNLFRFPYIEPEILIVRISENAAMRGSGEIDVNNGKNLFMRGKKGKKFRADDMYSAEGQRMQFGSCTDGDLFFFVGIAPATELLGIIKPISVLCLRC